MIRLILFFMTVPLFSHAEAKKAVVFNPNIVFRCDALFRPNDCTDSTTGAPEDLQSSFESNLGLRIGSANKNVAALPPRPPQIHLLFSTTAPAVTVSISSTNAGVATMGNNSLERANNTDRYDSRDQTPSFQNGNNPVNYASLQAPAINTQNIPNGRVVGGVPYTGDEPEKDEPSGNVAAGTMASLMPSAKDLNNQNAAAVASSPSGDGGQPFSSAGLSGHNQGTFVAGDQPVAASAATTDGNNSYLDRLKKIASSMMGGAFNVGGRKSNGQFRKANGNTNLAKLKRSARELASVGPKGVSLNPNMLKDQYGRYIANQPQFGRANSSLFGSMCAHYVKYARRNRIPDDKTRCPKQ